MLMKTTILVRASLAVLAGLLAATPRLPAADSATPTPAAWAVRGGKPTSILYFTKSSGFEHSVVKRPAKDQLSFSEQVMTDLARQHGFTVVCTKDGGVFDSTHLAAFDVVVFFTSAILFDPGTDQTPPMTPAGKAALLGAVKNGKGFVALHAANDSFHFQPDPEDQSQRFVAHGAKVDPYIAMVGGEFIRHGPQQTARMRVVDNKFPGLEDLKEGFDLLDEWYTFKDFAPDLHVLLAQETKGMKGIDYQRAPYPATWAHHYGRGRVFYTSLGHREDVWTNPLFHRILLGGLGWAAGHGNPDVSPNLEQATPGYREIQPKDEPKK